MDKLRQKLHIPKAKTYHGDMHSLDCMVRESMYFVWPAAGINDKENKGKRGLRRQDRFYESDPEDDDDDDDDDTR